MSFALSNPYEVVIGDVVIKCIPYGAGFIVTDEDIENRFPVEKRSDVVQLLKDNYVVERMEKNKCFVYRAGRYCTSTNEKKQPIEAVERLSVAENKIKSKSNKVLEKGE